MPSYATEPPPGTLRLPSSLLAHARWMRLGADVPTMIVHPDPDHAEPAPALLWMHGRTVRKEIDPGRGLRLMRSGIALCAIDLPGHGERFDRALQQPENTLDVIAGMLEEIDDVTDALADLDGIDDERLAIGGMSAGGMVTLARLCREHRFRGATVEATTGSWAHQRHREMFRGHRDEDWRDRDPVQHLPDWREIPLQAFHSRLDEWVTFEGQAAFIDALRAQYADPELIEFVVYDRTGAPFEHAGFGNHAADAKERQRAFLDRVLGSYPQP